MTAFFAMLRLQLLSRYADLKPQNLRNALQEKKGRTIGIFLAFLFLIGYLGVILYIVETKVLDVLMKMGPNGGMPDMLIIMAVMLSTAGTLVMAFFFVMSSLFLGRDAVFLASMPIPSRTVLAAKLTQVWISETLIDAVILLPACILYGTRVGVNAMFYVRLVPVWLLVSVLPICIAAVISSFLIRVSVLWKHREAVLTVGGIAFFALYMVLMMNVGAVTGDSAEGGEMIEKFFTEYAARINGMTSFFPPAGWAAKGLLGDWGMLGLFALVSAAGACLLIWGLGFFYRKLSLLQAETPAASGKKGIQKGSIRSGSAYLANVKREFLQIIRVPSYATNILPVSFMPLLMVIMFSVVFKRTGGEEAAQGIEGMLSNLNAPALVMCILAAIVAYMSGMNPALSTAVTREGRGHEFIKALPVNPMTVIHAKLSVGYGLQMLGIIAAFIAIAITVPFARLEAILAFLLCAVFNYGCACLALSRDVKKPRLDWVTEQEAVKQNFGVIISMLLSWAVLVALAGLSYLMIDAGWGLLPVFAVLMAILLALAAGAFILLKKNVKKYYTAG